MLGKQGWRLLSEPTSLMARIFKARYYLNTSFLEANLGSNPSYVWRSVLAVQGLIHSGVRWRIGKGDRVNIWLKPWLSDKANPFVETIIVTGLEHAVEARLIPHLF